MRDKNGNKNERRGGPVDAPHIDRCLETGDDFAFEMRVLHVLKSIELRSVDLSVEHGGTYVDPITSLPRQFDIRARFTRPSVSVNSLRRIRMSIECKRLQPDAPLVISRSERTSKESFHDYIRAISRPGVRTNFAVTSASPALTFYQQGMFVGRSVSQVRSTQEAPVGDADIYKQWSQALASADELIWEGARDESGPQSIVHSATLPCLIIPDNTLWTVDYDCQGNRAEPIEATNCEFYLGKPSFKRDEPAKFTITHLHIFTIGGLRNFLVQKIGDGDYWYDHFPPE